MLKYTIEFVPDRTIIRLNGNIDEQAGPVVAEMRRRVLGSSVCFDCDQVGIINSIGAATWLSGIQAFGGLKLVFIRCPHTFTALCLMLPDFTLGGEIESLYVRYACFACNRSGNALVTQLEVAQSGGIRPCPHCGRQIRLDEDDIVLVAELRGESA